MGQINGVFMFDLSRCFGAFTNLLLNRVEVGCNKRQRIEWNNNVNIQTKIHYFSLWIEFNLPSKGILNFIWQTLKIVSFGTTTFVPFRFEFSYLNWTNVYEWKTNKCMHQMVKHLLWCILFEFENFIVLIVTKVKV